MQAAATKRFAITLLILAVLATLPAITEVSPAHAGKVITIKGVISHDYRNYRSGLRYAGTLAIASKYKFTYGMLMPKFTHYVTGVPRSKYTIIRGALQKNATFVEMRVRLSGKQVRQGAYVVGAYADFVDFAGATKQAMDRERQAKERARAKAAREAERLRKQRLAEAKRQAAEAREKAKREAEQQAAKAKALEAQPPRLLVGEATWKNDQVLELKLAGSTYTIHKCEKLCLDPATKVEIKVRRVDTAGPTGFKCDFVAWDQAFLKEYRARLNRSEAKKKALRAKVNEIEKRFNENKAERDALMARLDGLLAKYPLFRIVGEVIDRDRDKLMIFGKAVPMGGNMNTYGAVLRDASIVAINPRVQGMPRKYVGDHHFLRKAKGVNAYNAPVPVWVYGDLPKPVLDKVKPLSKKIEKLDMDLNADKVDYHKIGKALNRCVIE